MKDAIKNKLEYINQRDTLGMKIRYWEAMGGQWRLQALFALLVEAMNTRALDGMRSLLLSQNNITKSACRSRATV